MATNLSEVEKRNKYLIGDVGDWYLHLDADEEWVGDICIPNADMQIAWMSREKEQRYTDNMKRWVDEHKRYVPNNCKRIRLFKHVPGLHYEGKHYWLRDVEGKTFSLLDRPGSNYSYELVKEIKLIHHENVRTLERHRLKKRYYRELCKIENKIREEI
jgi:hypothetical protein